MEGRAGSQDGSELVDAVVVGAGFSGLYMLHRLKVRGFSVQGFEKGSDVGGTWYWNRYPGCRCDVDSFSYSFSFDEKLEQEWSWTERYPSQPEIEAYLSHVSDRFDLRSLIAFNTTVESSEWIEEERRWRVCTDRGNVVKPKFIILATGALSASKVPDIEGVDDFQGEVLYTSRWPKHDVQFEGKRVAVIGTGSTGIQAIPAIAQKAASVTVYQRTPAYVVPARNQPLSPDQIKETKSRYREFRSAMRESRSGLLLSATCTGRPALATPEDEREEIYEKAWQEGGVLFLSTFSDILINPEANHTAAEFVRKKIRTTLTDPDVAESLSPRDYHVGTRRLAIGTDYYEAFNRANVALKDLRKTPIRKLVQTGVELADGGVNEADVIVMATGFDALTGSFLRIQIRNSDGEQQLSEKWNAGGPRSYLGLMSHGFPNLFFVAGPCSPSVLSNMVLSIEQHVEWIGDCLEAMRAEGLSRIEPTLQAEDEWVEKCNAYAALTLFPTARSWYLGSNIEGKPRMFMVFVGGVDAYRGICDNVVANDYEGFVRSKSLPSKQGT